MLIYHEIYPLENAADKISNELDYLLQTKPRMYKTTKEKYKQLACQLLESVEKISMLLEEELLVSDSLDEFDELSNQSNSLSDIQSKLIETNSTVSSTQAFAVNVDESKGKDRNNKLDYSSIIHKYEDVFNCTTSSESNYLEVEECAQLIRDWFNCRFVVNTENFVYNIKQLPNWISNIITLYGKYQSEGRTSELLTTFQKWIQDVNSGKNNKWAVPYEVLQLSKKPNPNDFTINAVLINDILFNLYYYQLTNYHDSNLSVYLSSDEVITRAKDMNPSLVPKIRTRLNKQSELIKECNLHYLEE